MSETVLPAGERLEAAVLEILHAEAEETLREQLGFRVEPFDGALVSIAANDPSIMLNRTLGLGLARPATPETVHGIRERYAAAGIDHYFVQVHPAAQPGTVDRLLSEAGLRRWRRWMKFTRGPEPPPDPASSLTVREARPHEAGAYGRIAAAAFDLTPEAAALFPGLVGQPGFRVYMSLDGGELAGGGVLYIDGDDAWLDWGATAPAFRGRGGQRALLARRIADAAAAGCTRLMTCTGEAVEGDPQHSYHNIEWAGFRADHLRENWVPA